MAPARDAQRSLWFRFGAIRGLWVFRGFQGFGVLGF